MNFLALLGKFIPYFLKLLGCEGIVVFYADLDFGDNLFFGFYLEQIGQLYRFGCSFCPGGFAGILFGCNGRYVLLRAAIRCGRWIFCGWRWRNGYRRGWRAG